MAEPKPNTLTSPGNGPRIDSLGEGGQNPAPAADVAPEEPSGAPDDGRAGLDPEDAPGTDPAPEAG